MTNSRKSMGVEDDTSGSSTSSLTSALPSVDSDTIDVSYPVFASAWESNSSLVIGGGGGEGRNGVQNKISIIKVKPESKALIIKSEIVLAADEDNPTSLDVSGSGKIYAGVNRSTQDIKDGNNSHLRVFSYKHGKDKTAIQSAFKVFSSSEVDEYQKCTKVSDSGEILALSSSLSPGSIHVFKTELLRPGVSSSAAAMYRKTLGVGYVNDLDFSPDSEKLAYINDSKLYIVNATTGDENIVVDIPRKDAKFSKLRFIDEKLIIVAANINQRKGVVLYKFNPSTGAKLSNKTLSSKIKAISTMDAGTKYTILGTSDCSVAIVSTVNLGLLKKLDKVHEIAITSVALNPSQTRIASTSVSGTVRVLELPLDGIFNGGIKSIIYAFWSVILIGSLAIVLQILMKRQFFDDLIGLAKDNQNGIGLLRRSDSLISTGISDSLLISITTSDTMLISSDTSVVSLHVPTSTSTNFAVNTILVDNPVSRPESPTSISPISSHKTVEVNTIPTDNTVSPPESQRSKENNNHIDL